MTGSPQIVMDAALVPRLTVQQGSRREGMMLRKQMGAAVLLSHPSLQAVIPHRSGWRGISH